jgi:hypothetical protein
MGEDHRDGEMSKIHPVKRIEDRKGREAEGIMNGDSAHGRVCEAAVEGMMSSKLFRLAKKEREKNGNGVDGGG